MAVSLQRVSCIGSKTCQAGKPAARRARTPVVKVCNFWSFVESMVSLHFLMTKVTHPVVC